MTINAGSSNPLDHTDDRDTGVSLGKKGTVKKKSFWERLFRI